MSNAALDRRGRPTTIVRNMTVKADGFLVALIRALGRRIGSLESKMEELADRSPEVRRYIAYQFVQRKLRERWDRETQFLGHCTARNAQERGDG